MKMFVDTANLEEIEETLKRGFPAGITTNPSILAKEKKRDWHEMIRDIIKLCRQYKYDIPLSVEVFTTDADEMIRQAEDMVQAFGDYPNINIKVPIGYDELAVIHQLRQRNIKVNCTACMSYNQALMAARAGATFVSVFYGRVRDMGYDPVPMIKSVCDTFRYWQSDAQVIVGSIRHMQDINESFQAGADIVTIPPKFFEPMTRHPKTDEIIDQFMTDFTAWNSPTNNG